MAAEYPPQITSIDTASAFRISHGDTVKLAPLRDPDELYPTSIFFEIWDPGGAQPPNSHPRSVETFLFLAGEGMASCDDVVTPVRAGQFLVLPPGSVHYIRNSGPGRLYAITTMSPDEGFAALVRAGEPEPLDSEDLAVITSAGSKVSAGSRVSAGSKRLPRRG